MNDYIVQPVDKALQVLLFLAESPRELGLTEIAFQVGIPKTTVFRYLHTLVARGFVRHDPETDRYGLGVRLWELGQKYGKSLPLRETAVPFMQHLRDRFNETVNLGMLDERDVVYLEMVASNQALRMLATIGGRDPVYSTALGKAILAYVPDEQIQRHLPARLVPRTSNTLTTLADLRHDLHLTRTRGYALDRGENEDGAYCIAAPIFDHRRRAIAAISLSAPAARLSEQIRQEMPAVVVSTAMAVSQRLGYTAVTPG